MKGSWFCFQNQENADSGCLLNSPASFVRLRQKELCRRVAACAALCGPVVFIINNRINLSAVSTPAIKGPAPANQMRAPSSDDSCSADNSAKLLKLPGRPALFTGVGALINWRSWVGWAWILRQSSPAPMSTYFPTFGSIQGIHLDFIDFWYWWCWRAL